MARTARSTDKCPLPPELPRNEPGMARVGSDLVFWKTKITTKHISTLRSYAVAQLDFDPTSTFTAGLTIVKCPSPQKAKRLWEDFNQGLVKNSNGKQLCDEFVDVNFPME